MNDMDDLMDALAADQNDESLVYAFRDYYQEQHPHCFVTTDGKKLTITWCRLDDNKALVGEADACMVELNAKKVIMTPSSGNSYAAEFMPEGKKKVALNITDDFIDRLREVSSGWKGEKSGDAIVIP